MFKKVSWFLIILHILKVSTTPILNDNSDEVCSTAACHQDAKQILESMDLSVDPCDNFYQFACGKFISETNIPADKDFVSYMSLLEEKINEELRSSFVSHSLPNEPKFYTLAKRFYKTCMNHEIDQNNRDLLFEIIEKVGGWPIVEGDNWNEDDFDWIESISNLIEMGFEDIKYFINFDVILNPKDNKQHIINLIKDSQPSNNFYDRPSEIFEIAESLGADSSFLRDECHDLSYFSKSLSILYRYDFFRRSDDSSVNNTSIDELSESCNVEIFSESMTIKEMSQMLPSIDWKKYINRMFLSTVEIKDNDIVIGDFDFLSRLIRLLNDTPKRILANYMIFHIILESLEFLTEDIRDIKNKYAKIGSDRTMDPSRREHCVNIVKTYLDKSVGALYVRNYFNEESKLEVMNMVGDIERQFVKNLENNEWLDEKTKEKAIKKVELMVNLIAYPEEYLNDTVLDDYYMDLELSDNNYLQSYLNIKLFKRKKNDKKLRDVFDKFDWVNYIDATIINACNFPNLNSISISAASLQELYSNNNRQKYINYARIGSFIGHEITHGFDADGIDYDEIGNLRNWWNCTIKNKFFEKKQCYADQYNKYAVGDKHLNGTYTLDENIADNGGIRAAYLAYKNWSVINKAEQKLPGLSYNPLQMFWISKATISCTKYRPSFANYLLSNDPHSLESFRVIGPFSNMPEFSEDFNCPADSNMNPKNKCTMW